MNTTTTVTLHGFGFSCPTCRTSYKATVIVAVDLAADGTVEGLDPVAVDEVELGAGEDRVCDCRHSDDLRSFERGSDRDAFEAAVDAALAARLPATVALAA